MTAADQPTTEPSVCGAPNPGDGAGGPCLRSPGHGGIHFNTVRGWPLAPAPQPAADTKTEVQWGVRSAITGDVRTYADEDAVRRVAGTRLELTVVTRTITPWEEA